MIQRDSWHCDTPDMRADGHMSANDPKRRQISMPSEDNADNLP